MIITNCELASFMRMELQRIPHLYDSVSYIDCLNAIDSCRLPEQEGKEMSVLELFELVNPIILSFECEYENSGV